MNGPRQPDPGTEAPRPPLPRLVWVNFLLLAALGLAFLGWAAYFTDWLPVALAAVGLGGVLAWPRSLLKWVPAVGQHFERGLQAALAGKATLALLAAALAGGVAAACFVGGVAVASQDEGTRRVDFALDGERAGARRLAAGGRVRLPVWTGLRRERSLTVEVEGRPPRPVTVAAMDRVDLLAPDDFAGHAVLVRPSRRFALMASTTQDLAWRIRVGSEERTHPFDGRAVWVGCTVRCDLPEGRRAFFEEQLGPLAELWTQPAELAGEPLDLAPGDRVDIVLHRGGEELVGRSFVVPAAGFFHEVPIDGP